MLRRLKEGTEKEKGFGINQVYSLLKRKKSTSTLRSGGKRKTVSSELNNGTSNSRVLFSNSFVYFFSA